MGGPGRRHPEMWPGFQRSSPCRRQSHGHAGLLTPRQPCGVTLPSIPTLCPESETRATDGEYQLGGFARVALVSLTLSAGFGLAGCAAIDDLKVSMFRWLHPVNFTGEGEELLGYAPETRLIPPAEIPKQAAKAPSKRIKPATRKLQRPETVVLPPKKPPIFDSTETAPLGETEGQFGRPPTMRSRIPYPEAPPPFDERFCAECWGLPAKAE